MRIKENLTGNKGAILGASFLMATSAIGPGFQTQVAVFTQNIFASFGFVILLTCLIDLSTQLNTWRVLTVTGLRAQDLANKIFPGLGYVLAVIVMLGGVAFNIGNISGSGLGLNVLFNLNPSAGAIMTCGIALIIFWIRDSSKVIDIFSKVIGVTVIALSIYVAFKANPPMMQAIQGTIKPTIIDPFILITIFGGSVGGYISFVGSHRLLDAGIKGTENLPQVNKSVYTGVSLTATMRTMLFLAALGVVSAGVMLDPENPPAAVFKSAAGELGYRIFGIVMWGASVTAVIGAAFTSVSFFRSLHPWFDKNYRILTTLIILLSTLIFVLVGKPVRLLIIAGSLNGLILPVTLSVILIAVQKKKIMGDYFHPVWLRVAGWLVVVIMLSLSIYSLKAGFHD